MRKLSSHCLWASNSLHAKLMSQTILISNMQSCSSLVCCYIFTRHFITSQRSWHHIFTVMNDICFAPLSRHITHTLERTHANTRAHYKLWQLWLLLFPRTKVRTSVNKHPHMREQVRGCEKSKQWSWIKSTSPHGEHERVLFVRMRTHLLNTIIFAANNNLFILNCVYVRRWDTVTWIWIYSYGCGECPAASIHTSTQITFIYQVWRKHDQVRYTDWRQSAAWTSRALYPRRGCNDSVSDIILVRSGEVPPSREFVLGPAHWCHYIEVCELLQIQCSCSYILTV